MAWTQTTTWTTGETVTAAQLNAMRDNFNETEVAKVSAMGDLISTTGAANSVKRQALGADASFLTGLSTTSNGIGYQSLLGRTAILTTLASVAAGGATTSYSGPGYQGLGTTEDVHKGIMPFGGTVRNLYLVATGTQSTSGSLVATLRKNSTNTAITATIGAGATGTTFGDLTHTVTYTSGDYLSLGLLNNATSNSLTLVGWSVEMTARATTS